MIYCDTSLLVAALTVEPGSERVVRWLDVLAIGEACISGWVVAEFSSALALKVRRGEVPDSEREIILANWRQVRREYLRVVPVRQGAFGLAAQLCDQDELGLRSADALHLAVALQGGHRLATLDKVLAGAARAHGVVVEGPDA